LKFFYNTRITLVSIQTLIEWFLLKSSLAEKGFMKWLVQCRMCKPFSNVDRYITSGGHTGGYYSSRLSALLGNQTLCLLENHVLWHARLSFFIVIFFEDFCFCTKNFYNILYLPYIISRIFVRMIMSRHSVYTVIYVYIYYTICENTFLWYGLLTLLNGSQSWKMTLVYNRFIYKTNELQYC